MNLDCLRKSYFDYVDTFRVDGVLPPMMELKRLHTMKVVENAVAIGIGEGFDVRTAEACEAAALLHDTGRYEQLKRYNTFRDSDSVDHAVFSHDIVREKGWLDQVEGRGEGGEWKDAVLKAILYHNRRDLPEGLDALTETAAKCVRDADKLDIFRVLESLVSHTDWRTDRTAFWGLAVDRAPNPLVVEAVRDGRPVDYQNIASLADFVLIQVGWIRSGLAFGTSRRICRARGHLEFRRKFLLDLVGFDFCEQFCRADG